MCIGTYIICTRCGHDSDNPLIHEQCHWQLDTEKKWKGFKDWKIPARYVRPIGLNSRRCKENERMGEVAVDIWCTRCIRRGLDKPVAVEAEVQEQQVFAGFLQGGGDQETFDGRQFGCSQGVVGVQQTGKGFQQAVYAPHQIGYHQLAGSSMMGYLEREYGVAQEQEDSHCNPAQYQQYEQYEQYQQGRQYIPSSNSSMITNRGSAGLQDSNHNFEDEFQPIKNEPDLDYGGCYKADNASGYWQWA